MAHGYGPSLLRKAAGAAGFALSVSISVWFAQKYCHRRALAIETADGRLGNPSDSCRSRNAKASDRCPRAREVIYVPDENDF
jgi:hypothetical protein